ncbi:hypothetical protein [Butyrivibrio sp. VCB2006]|uniref:hypothetical protein n=1 Tax=Butyrivibrio sp. VCB2006 TaxID=1280679 RepID=UPI00040FB4B4|nr:hypothetical protein [Butyrivibrio sp. VCB2006]
MSQNKIRILSIAKTNNTVNVEYSASGECTKYLTDKRNFAITYSFDVEEIPDSICVIPFVGNFLPFIFLFDADLYVNSIDETFMNCIDEVRGGYKEMYPMMNFAGRVHAEKLESVPHPTSKHKAAAFFSGGVDAYTTLIRHIEEKPLLITLAGADVKLDDLSGISQIFNMAKQAALNYDLDTVFISSEFRKIFDEGSMIEYLEPSKDRWWHGFHHGIGIISHAALASYYYGIETVYIASSFTETLKGTYTCASDPLIDNHIKYVSSKVIHDSYDMNRQQKISFLVDQKYNHNRASKVHVCFLSSGGHNCCRCEKCYRTIFQIAAAGGNPSDFGFTWNKDCVDDFISRLETKDLILDYQKIHRYFEPTQRLMQENENIIPNVEWYKPFINYDFNKYADDLRAYIKAKYSHPRAKKVIRKIKGLLH